MKRSLRGMAIRYHLLQEGQRVARCHRRPNEFIGLIDRHSGSEEVVVNADGEPIRIGV